MLTVFTKETAGGKYRQFLKLIMLLFTVQFFHPVLLKPVCIFSIYSGDNDDNSHLHIAFHLKASSLPPFSFSSYLMPTFIPPLTFLPLFSFLPSFFFSLPPLPTLIAVCSLLQGNRKCNLQHSFISQWEEKPQGKHWKRRPRNRRWRRKVNMLPCLLRRGPGPRTSILPVTMPALL